MAMSMLMNSRHSHGRDGMEGIFSEVLLAHGLQIAWEGAFEKTVLKSRLRSIIRAAFLPAHHIYALSAVDTGRKSRHKGPLCGRTDQDASERNLKHQDKIAR